MATFMERMRAPLLLGNGFDGSETAGQSDALSRMASLNELNTLLGGSLGRSGGGRRDLAMGRGPRVNPKVNPYGRAVDPNKGPMNVVYDRGPEEFNKKLKMQDKELDIKGRTADALAGLKLGQLDVSQQNADTNRFRAEITDRTKDMTDTERTAAALQKALEIEGARFGGRKEIPGMNNASREGMAANRIKSQEEMAAESIAARNAQIAAQGKGAMDRQNDAQAYDANKPQARATAVNNRAREVIASDPDAASGVEFDPQGNWKFRDGAPEEFKARFNARVYGPQQKQITEQPGIANQQSLNPGLTGGTNAIPMVFPDGSVRNVDPAKVQAAMSAGAKRR